MKLYKINLHFVKRKKNRGGGGIKITFFLNLNIQILTEQKFKKESILLFKQI